MTKWGELVLGAILVLVFLPLSLISLFFSAIPFVGSFFGGLSLIFIFLLVVGVALLADSHETSAKPTPTPALPTPASVSSEPISGTLTALERRILTLLAEHKKPEEISNTTGVSLRIIEEKIASLYNNSLITDRGELTEKGYGEVGNPLPPKSSSLALPQTRIESGPSPSAPGQSEIKESEFEEPNVGGRISSLWAVPIVFAVFSAFFYNRYSSQTWNYNFYWGSVSFFIATVVMVVAAAVWEAVRRRGDDESVIREHQS